MLIDLRRDEWGLIDTPGSVFVDGEPECRSLEDPVRELLGKPVRDWKIPGDTAIPAGVYRLTLEESPKFGPGTITLHNVPGYTGVRMHAGNDEDDTEGCPLVGERLEREGDGSWRIAAGTSRPALMALKVKVAAALDAGEDVWLRITNPEAWPV